MPLRSFENFKLIMSRHMKELRGALGHGLFNICVNPSLGKSSVQWRSEECRPGPTIKVPTFPPLRFAYKNFKWKFMFRANLKI